MALPRRPSRARTGALLRSSGARGLALLALVVVMFARFFQVQHELSVRHVFCEEHGELTHLALSSAPRAVSPPGTEADSGEVSAALPHDHCEIAFAPGSLPHPRPPRLAATLLEPSPLAAPPRAAPSPGGRDVVLASAPKTSPPRA